MPIFAFTICSYSAFLILARVTHIPNASWDPQEVCEAALCCFPSFSRWLTSVTPTVANTKKGQLSSTGTAPDDVAKDIRVTVLQSG